MVGLLLRLLVAATGVLGLLAAGAWVVVDSSAAGLLRDELAGFGLRDLVTLREAGLPSPTRLVITGIVLRDPLTEATVARVQRLEVEVALWDGGFAPRVLSIRGEGGEAVFGRDEAGVPFIRAINALVQRVSGTHLARPTAQPAPSPEPAQAAGQAEVQIPPITFTDIDAMLVDDEGVPTILRGCSARVTAGGGTRVDIDVGPGGSVQLRFGAGGLRKVHVTGVAITPVCAVFLPEDVQAAADDLRPSGVLDLDLTLDPDDPSAALATGRMREAVLRPALVPFPLEQATLPFVFERGRFTVADAELVFPGGEARGGVTADADGLVLDVKVEGAEFRREDLQILPQAEDLDWLAPEDGGNLDLDLRLTWRAGHERVDIEGGGGLFLERVRVGPRKVLVEDMVGSIDVRNHVMTFKEVSGRCAGGVARLAGRLDLRTGDVVVDGAVFDVDIALVDRAMDATGSAAREVAGWLQGGVHWEGRLGEPRTGRGEGQFSVRGGYLWTVPVLDAVLRSMSIARPARQRSDSLAVAFHVRGLTLYADELMLKSEVITLRGDGKITRGGELNLDITPMPGSGTIGAVLRYLQEQFVKLELRGNYENPKVRVIPLKFLTGPIGDAWDWFAGLFGSDEAEVSPDGAPPAPP